MPLTIRPFLITSIVLSMLGLAGFTQSGRAEDANEDRNAGMFPFVVSYDAPDNATNIAASFDKPAGKHGFVRSEGSQFVTDAGPIRFWGTNLCFDACFPTHENAEKLAKRLARFGINCIRLHHMDSRSIWGDSGNHLDIDPKQLDRLDYLIYQLKLNGIYVDINLHVSRMFDERDGDFPGKDLRPKYDKGLDNFEPRMIELQKKYARDLLTHVNPYTGRPYTDEPAVAMVEINNENSVLSEWTRQSLDHLPEPYATTYREQWNAWLRTKYGTTARLREAWNVGAAPLGDEMLDTERFALQDGKPASCWYLQNDMQSQAELQVIDGSLQIDVQKEGEVAWIPQLIYRHVVLEKGKPYTIRLRIRAANDDKLTLSVGIDHDPWGSAGMSRPIPVTPQWKDYEFTFLASTTDEMCRLSINGLKLNGYEISELSLRPGGINGLLPGQQLDNNTVPVIRRDNLNVTRTAREDFIDFIWATEQNYWTGIDDFLKDELGLKSIVSGTQLRYGPTHVQAMLDYVDIHRYWHHPAFPGKPWDRDNWYVNNVAMVNQMTNCTLTEMAVMRVAGMPMTVSEYNHPQPNQYGAEGFPMLAAYGSLQRWNGLFPFTYSNNEDLEPQKITGFFDIKNVPDRMAHMIACSNLFLRGDVAGAKETVRIGMDEQRERKMLYEELTTRNGTLEYHGVDPREALVHAVELDMDGRSSSVAPLPADAKVLVSDTRQIAYDINDPQQGRFLVNTPNTVLFTGFVPEGSNFQLGNISLAIGATEKNWATVSITSIEGNGITTPGRVLIAATGQVRNTGMQLRSLGGDRVTVGREWGDAPSLCEGVPASISLKVPANRVRCYPLDPSGNRGEAMPIEAKTDGMARVQLSPDYKTIWYELEIME